jgi:hypothetical protein
VSQLQGARGLETLCVCAVHRPRRNKLPKVQGKRDGSKKVAAPRHTNTLLACSLTAFIVLLAMIANVSGIAEVA